MVFEVIRARANIVVSLLLWAPTASVSQASASALTAPSQPKNREHASPTTDGPDDSDDTETATATSAPQQLARFEVFIAQLGSRSAIAASEIIVDGGDKVVRGDEFGRAILELSPGHHQLTIVASGYDDLNTAITLTPRQSLKYEYRLSRTLEGGTYRTVVRQRREVAISSVTLRGPELRQVPGTGGDPLRVISSLPGVAPLSGFLPYVVVRGAAPGNTGYYLDGSRVPLLFHVALGPSVIHPYFIDSVDFYPSGAPARLGRFVSGIVEARTRAARKDRVRGDIELRVTDAGGLLEIPINRSYLPGCREHRKLRCKRGPGRGSLTFAGRYSYTEPILALAKADARIRYWDYQARFEHPVSGDAELSIFAFGAFDEVGQKPYHSGSKRIVPDPWVRFLFHRVDTRVRQRLPRGGTARYALVLGVDQGGITKYRNNEWRIAPRIDLTLPLRNKVVLGLGLDQEFQIFRLATKLGDIEDVAVEDIGLLFSDRFVSVTGAYVDARVTRGGVEVRPGVRVDIYNQLGASPYVPNAKAQTHAIGVDPRLSLRERIGRRWVLRQAAGIYHQAPSFPVPVPGVESFGFERGLQQNIQASAGYELEIVRDRLTLTQEAYVGRLRNLQDYEFAQASAGEPINELEDVIRNVKGWAYGLETVLRLNPDRRAFGWVAYTLSRSTREYRVGGRAPSNWDQRHIVNLVLGYQVSKRWNLGMRMHYHTGRPWTAPVNDQSTVDALASNRNNARLPPFFQLDIRVERNWIFRSWQLDAFLDVANATYSREIFQCSADSGSTNEMMAMAGISRQTGVAKCSPQGFRYIVPSVGLRSRF